MAAGVIVRHAKASVMATSCDSSVGPNLCARVQPAAVKQITRGPCADSV